MANKPPTMKSNDEIIPNVPPVNNKQTPDTNIPIPPTS